MMNFPLPLWVLVGEGKKDRAAFALTQFDVVGDFAGEAERRRTTRLCLSWVKRYRSFAAGRDAESALAQKPT